MTQPRIVAFARLANGNVAPTRVIAGQETKLARTIHGIAYNPIRDEMTVANGFAAAILTFRGDANGAVAPIRIIQGPKTQLVSPHNVELDLTNRELLVADVGAMQVLIFPWDAEGDVAPLRIIKGPKTLLNFPVGPQVDNIRNLLVVSTYSEVPGKGTGDGKVLIFNRTDNGDVAPKRAIAGPRTGIRAPWQVRLDPEAGKIFVAVENQFRKYGRLYIAGKPQEGLKSIPPSPWRSDMPGFIAVWDINDNGDVPPKAVIKGLVSQLVHPSGLVIRPQDGEIIATDSVRNGVFTFFVPQLLGRSNAMATAKLPRQLY